MPFGYRGPKIDLAAEAEVHAPCDSCSEQTREELLIDVRGEQVCPDCRAEIDRDRQADETALWHDNFMRDFTEVR